MAFYADALLVRKASVDTFDKIHKPGDSPILSGIYLCTGCGKEIAHNGSNSLPPQNHHQHSASQGDIRWRMLIMAETTGNSAFAK